MNDIQQNFVPNGQSSPGSLQSGQQPSNAIRHMPQLSSFATQRHVATPVQPGRYLKIEVAHINIKFYNILSHTAQMKMHMNRLTFYCNLHVYFSHSFLQIY